MLTINEARRIVLDLNEKKNIDVHLEELQKSTVTADLLRTVDLEMALSKPSKNYCSEIQGLLSDSQQILKKDDETKENKLNEDDEMRESNLMRLKILKSRQLYAKAKKAAREENTKSKIGMKRKAESAEIVGEPETKKMKKNKKEGTENIDPKFDMDSFICEIEEEVENVPKLIGKIEDLSLFPSATEIAKCLEGVTASQLMDVEKYMGKMRYLDQFWWSLCERDFNFTRSPSSSTDPRQAYAKHMMLQDFDDLFSLNSAKLRYPS